MWAPRACSHYAEACRAVAINFSTLTDNDWQRFGDILSQGVVSVCVRRLFTNRWCLHANQQPLVVTITGAASATETKGPPRDITAGDS